MNHSFLKIIVLFLVSLMLVPTVHYGLSSNDVVVVGSIDPSLGYDEIINGTTTFLVARSQAVSHRTFYHNFTKYELKQSRVETFPETPSSYYDESSGKYYFSMFVAEPYNLTVPDPSGKVTVFSNMVFKGTNENPISKIVFHPDGTSQSILHVKGQTSDDPWPRDLTVTIYNSKYPSGYQVDSTIVQSSFDKSYDVTSIVAERDANNVSIVLGTCVGKWDVQSYFWVSTVGTDVYIAMIPDVATYWVSDMEAVRRGVEKACMIKPLVHLNDWKGLTYLEVVDMSTYQYIIEHPEYVRPPSFYGETGIIVVNAHGEVFPVPSGISRDSWVDTISLAVQTKGLTWVQVAGWPFYYYSSGSGTKTQVGSLGFQRFLQRILGSNTIDCLPNQEGCAVPLQGGYDNRLWGYGLIDGGLHEGRPLKIGNSTNIADLLDVMGYRSGGIEYLTLGLIGFAYPNQNVMSDQQVSYYVHNGAIWSDSDYNKGKYSMAVAAWTKISILASGWTDISCEVPLDGVPITVCFGSVKCKVAWSFAIPPSGSGDTWKVRIVTSTIAYLWLLHSVGGPMMLIDANAPLRISRSSPGTKFQFMEYQSTTLRDLSEFSWQKTIFLGVLFTAISVFLIPFTAALAYEAVVAVRIGLGVASTVTALAWKSPQPVTGPEFVDLALANNPDFRLEHTNGDYYKQLQSFGVTEVSLNQSPNGGASETLTFELGQKGCYQHYESGKDYWPEGILTFEKTIVVEPYQSADSNQSPQTPQTPSGPNSEYRNTSYVYSTSTSDPENDDVGYIFYWGDGTNTTTNWYESGNTVSVPHQWNEPGTYFVQVQAQDCQGAYTALSSSLTVTIVNRAPNTPSKPSGPTSGYTGTSYSYSTSTTDPDGDNVCYQFDWGDGSTTTTDWYSSGATAWAYHAWSSPGTYYVRVRAIDSYGDWSYFSSSLTVTIVEREREACPFVYAWDGQRYVLDNNLLPTSPKSNGADVEDYYKLEQTLVPKYEGKLFSLYSLQVGEFENEHSYIDQVRLFAVDHNADFNIAVTPDGEIVTYRQPQPPLSCIDNNGTSRLSEISLIDGNISDPVTYFYGERGDYLILDFGQINAENAKLILRSDMKCEYPNMDPPCCIEVQVLDNGEWQKVAVVVPREYWATEAVNLTPYIIAGQDLIVRLYWTLPHRLDYVGLDTTPQDSFELHYATLISATHSSEGNVRRRLLENDQTYAELTPGQQIQLTFQLPNNQNQERTFILYTEGHYTTIET